MEKLQNITTFSNKMLNGNIPSEIKFITLLKELILSHNYFTSNLTYEVGSLIKVEMSNLSDSSFTRDEIIYVASALTDLRILNA